MCFYFQVAKTPSQQMRKDKLIQQQIQTIKKYFSVLIQRQFSLNLSEAAMKTIVSSVAKT